MPFSNYPKVKPPLGSASLKEPYPVWFLDPRGVIQAANLLAFWLWEAILPGKNFHAHTLLNESVFNIITTNLKRIPVKQNTNFYAIKSAVVKRMDAGLHSPLYASFISAMENDPQRRKIFDYANPNPDREWEYFLKITTPRENGTVDLLGFHVNVYRLVGDRGLLAVYIPDQNTLAVIEEQYSQLIGKYGHEAFVQANNLEVQNIGVSLNTNIISFRYAYYPSLRLDLLWNIMENNELYMLLYGASVRGKHFFDIIFSSPFREWQGSIYDTSALLAITCFDTFITSFIKNSQDLYIEYELLMEHLLQLPDFQRLLEISRNMSKYMNIPNNMEGSFYMCRVLLPWPISNDIILQFRAISQLGHEELPDHKSVRKEFWEVILIPENYETEAALIFINLSRTLASAISRSKSSLDQFIWILAVILTIEEGILQKEIDAHWQPRPAFNRFLKRLVNEFSNHLASDIEEVVARFRAILETMDKTGVLDKKTVLNMLLAVVSQNNFPGKLKEYLINELRIHKEVEERLGKAEIFLASHEMEWIMPGDATNKEKVENPNEGELKTIVFDNEKEYVRFTDYVFEEYGGEGLAFTDVPIVTSVCVTEQLFEQTYNQFDMHPVTDEDIEQAKADNAGR